MIDAITLTLITLAVAVVSFGAGLTVGGLTQLLFRNSYAEFLREQRQESEELIEAQRAEVENKLHQQVAQAQSQVSQIYRDALNVQQQTEGSSGGTPPIIGNGVMN